jgi:hypothetical protein
MADSTKKDDAPAAQPQAEARKGHGLRLVPRGDSDQPVFANVCNVNIAPGVAFIDFGFLEPAVTGHCELLVYGGR